jgi:mono/diheme cytochrome c family protein
MINTRHLLALLLSGSLGLAALSTRAAGTAPRSRADFVETNFPFFSSVVDARKSPGAFPSNNLTPRGLVLNLGQNCWACFDVDLLRVAAVWRGDALTPESMSQGSYHTAGLKAPEGQGKLPEPNGEVWLANGIYPGWQIGSSVSLEDPREPTPDPREVGRGPLPPGTGRFRAMRLVADGVRLEYDAGGSLVRESVRAVPGNPDPMIERRIRCEPSAKPRWLLAGYLKPELGIAVRLNEALPGAHVNLESRDDGLKVVHVSASEHPIEFALLIGRLEDIDAIRGGRGNETHPEVRGPKSEVRTSQSLLTSASTNLARWPQVLTTRGHSSSPAEAYVVENIGLPLNNPWRRNVRLADLAFFNDGRAAAVTFDGDVWLIDGLRDNLGAVRWRRFASGLHEPLSLVAREGEIVVFDRNGLWRLRDTDGNGEADVQELVSNAFTQTAETREFTTGMRLAPDGSFILSKGGQQSSTIGRHNGTVLRVPADGSPAEVLGYGLRMPFIGVHPRTGLITASDQQGHYVPATPLHLIGGEQFYGFISLLLPKEQYPAPIAEPLTWIPHPVNPSGASQVWLTGARMGPLNDALIHLGYYRPEIFVVRMNDRGARAHAAVMSLTRDLAFPPLNGAVNPVDGQLYVIGFQIWGTEARQISGLARVRYTGQPFTMPREIVPMKQGVFLRFDVALDSATATNLANFSAERWNYRRTPAYGSPHFKLDGSKGQEAMTPSSAYISADGRSVFVGLPDMRPVMQMRLGWTLGARDGAPASHNAYFTVTELPEFDAVKEGFAPLNVDLTPRPALARADTPITAAEGRRVSELMGCVACHSTDGTTLGKVGPTWKGLFRRERMFADGSKALADEAYLRESIREPAARVVAGFDKSDTGMPSYEGVITDAQIEALVEYLKTVE